MKVEAVLLHFVRYRDFSAGCVGVAVIIMPEAVILVTGLLRQLRNDHLTVLVLRGRVGHKVHGRTSSGAVLVHVGIVHTEKVIGCDRSIRHVGAIRSDHIRCLDRIAVNSDRVFILR